MEGSGICQVKSTPIFNIKTLFCRMNKNKPFENQGHILHAILRFKTLYLLANQLSRTDHIAVLHTGWRRLACSFNEVRVSLIMIFSSSKRIQRNKRPLYLQSRAGSLLEPPTTPRAASPLLKPHTESWKAAPLRSGVPRAFFTSNNPA